jgi:hypothetical protein
MAGAGTSGNTDDPPGSNALITDVMSLIKRVKGSLGIAEGDLGGLADGLVLPEAPPRRQAKPLNAADRVANYRRQNHHDRLKPGQRRRLSHKVNRAIKFGA